MWAILCGTYNKLERLQEVNYYYMALVFNTIECYRNIGYPLARGTGGVMKKLTIVTKIRITNTLWLWFLTLLGVIIT